MVPAMAQQTEAPGGRLARLFDAVQLFRPRTLARLGKTDEKLQQQVDALFAEIRTLKTELNQANVRERQLRAVLKAECGSDDSRVVHFEAALRIQPRDRVPGGVHHRRNLGHVTLNKLRRAIGDDVGGSVGK